MKKINWPLALSAAVCVLSLTAMFFALNAKPGKAEFSPPPFDPAAEAGVPAVPEGIGYGELDCRAYKVSLCGRPTAEGDLWLTNPKDNAVWLKVRVLDEQGTMLGETGLVRPGEYVRNVVWNGVAEAGTPVTLKIMAYEPETYYSAGAAALNTTIQ